MKSRVIAFDMTRLWLASFRAAPRGIERVDLTFAQDICANWPGEVYGLLTTPLGIRLFSRQALSCLADHVQTTWQENAAPHADGQFARVRSWLLDQQLEQDANLRPKPQPRSFAPWDKVQRTLRAIGATGIEWGRNAKSTLPEGSIYLNAGHIGLHAPLMAPFLNARPDLKVVTMIHDVLSFQMPQFFRKVNEPYFRKVFDQAARLSDLLLTTTQTTAQDLQQTLPQTIKPGQKTGVVAMNGSIQVPASIAADVELRSQPYFVCCGTIEPRKNHILLLNLWRDMIRDNPQAPKLLIAGSRGWGAQHVHAMLDRSPLLQERVGHVEGLGSPAMFHFLAHSRGLLMASHAEGFGLPVAEAQQLGTHVIASDIPVFREITGGRASLIDPIDGPGWRMEIEKRAQSALPELNTQMETGNAVRLAIAGQRDLLDWLGDL